MEKGWRGVQKTNRVRKKPSTLSQLTECWTIHGVGVSSEWSTMETFPSSNAAFRNITNKMNLKWNDTDKSRDHGIVCLLRKAMDLT